MDTGSCRHHIPKTVISYKRHSLWNHRPLFVQHNKLMKITTKKTSKLCARPLTHWGGVTHICVSKLTIIASDNGLSPGRRQAIIWNNDGILLIWPLGTNFSEILIEIHSFSFKKMHLKMSSGKWRLFCLGLNVLIEVWYVCVCVCVRAWCMCACILRTSNVESVSMFVFPCSIETGLWIFFNTKSSRVNFNNTSRFNMAKWQNTFSYIPPYQTSMQRVKLTVRG